MEQLFRGAARSIDSTLITKVEYIALGHAAREAVGIRRFINELVLEVVENVTLHDDNEMSITLTKNVESQRRTKHIDVKDHHIRVLISEGELTVVWVSSSAEDAGRWHDQSITNQDFPEALSIASDGYRVRGATVT